MKARIENNNIRLYNKLPQNIMSSVGTILRFDKASDAVHEANGFYNVVKPSFNNKTQEKSAIYFNEELNVFTYDVTDKVFTDEDVVNIKLTLKSDTRRKCGELLKDSDWKVIRQIERGVDMSDEDKQKRLDILDECSRIEDSIDELDNYIDLLNLNVSFFPVENDRDLI